MAKSNQTPDSATYEVEESTNSTSKFKRFTKNRGVRIGAIAAGGVLALGVAFGAGLAAGDHFGDDGRQFSQGQFGQGDRHEGHGEGPDHKRPPHGQGDRDFQMPDQMPGADTAPNDQTQQN